jgi:hypothetical protein
MLERAIASVKPTHGWVSRGVSLSKSVPGSGPGQAPDLFNGRATSLCRSNADLRIVALTPLTGRQSSFRNPNNRIEGGIGADRRALNNRSLITTSSVAAGARASAALRDQIHCRHALGNRSDCSVLPRPSCTNAVKSADAEPAGICTRCANAAVPIGQGPHSLRTTRSWRRRTPPFSPERTSVV